MPYTGSQAQAVKGTTIGIGATPTLIGEIKNFGEMAGTWAIADVSNTDSPAKEKLATLLDNGTITFTGNRVSSDAGQTAAEAAFQSGALTSFTLQFQKTGTQITSGDKYVFNAIVSKRTFGGDITKEWSWSITLDISGAVTETLGS